MQFWNYLENYGDNVALTTEHETVSYRALCETADAIVASIPSRSLVFLICKNQSAAIAGYLGFLRKHIVPVLINHTIDQELFEKQLSLYQPSYIWCPDDYLDAPGVYSNSGYKLIATGFESPKMHDDLALLITTSGSTGSPKLVRLSYENIQANTEAIVSYLKIQPTDKAITSLPMSYVYGLSIIQTHLAVGAGLILTEKTCFDKGFWDAFKQHGATTFSAVPYIYQILDKLAFLKHDLPTLRYVTQAGGRLGKILHEKLGRALLEKGQQLFVMYGASEATARMSYVPSERTIEKAGSIGIAIPGGHFELINKEGAIITENDTIGELVYYGPNVMLGYAKSRDDLHKGNELNGRLQTGDLAKRDQDGYYYIVGRKNRFVKVYGNRVNLEEVEELLKNQGYEIACIGEEDHIRIYTTTNACQRILDSITAKTHLDSAAFSVIHLEQIPRSDAGKVLYSKLQ